MPNWCSNSLTLTAATKEEAQELLLIYLLKKQMIGLSSDSLFQKLGNQKIGTTHG